jgi:starch-binding outer membrane protein, SusD/RagB family
VTDIRRAASLFNVLTVSGKSFYFTKKYSAGAAEATPVKLLRLSELYLIRAEAAAERATPDFTVANADLNTIMKRADASAVTVRYTDKATLVNAIMLERRKELAFEGNLLFDLVRKKIALTRTDCTATPNCNLPADDYRLVMPFPFMTISANRNVVQNEGY